MRTLGFGVILLTLTGQILAQADKGTGGQALGDDTSLEGLMSLPVNTVTGVSRFSQKSTDAPASVTVITSEEIEAQGWHTMADVFRSVRGFEVSSDRTYSYLGVRGFSRLGDFNTRLLFMVDGQRLNDNIYDGFQLDAGFGVSLGEVKRIEILRGPASSQYGNNAFFGVVNIVPMTGSDWAASGRQGGVARGGFGNNGARSGRVTAGGLLGKDAEYTISVAERHTDGEKGLSYPDAPTLSGLKSPAGSDTEDGRTARASVTWKRTELSAGWSERTKSIPTAPFGTVFGDTRTQGIDEIAWVRLAQTLEVSPVMRGEAAVNYSYYRYDGSYVFPDTGLPPPVFPLPPLVPGSYLVKDEATSGAYQAELSLNRDFGDGTLSFGTDARWQPRQEQRNYLSAPRIDYMDVVSDAFSIGAYSQLDWTFSPEWSASGGLRYDYDERIGGAIHPRGTLIWHPAQTDTIKLIGGTAYRAPNAYELYYDNGGLSQKAPGSLNAERITSYELLWEHFVTSRVKATVTVFWNELDGLISPVIDPADGLAVFQNLESVAVYGAEGEVEWMLGQGASLVASIAGQHIDQTGVPTSAAQVVGKLAARAPLPGVPLWAGLEVQHTGHRQARDGTQVDAFWLANASLGTREFHGLSARVSVRNLTDSHYVDPVGDDFEQRTIVQPGRSWDITVYWRF